MLQEATPRNISVHKRNKRQDIDFDFEDSNNHESTELSKRNRPRRNKRKQSRQSVQRNNENRKDLAEKQKGELKTRKQDENKKFGLDGR